MSRIKIYVLVILGLFALSAHAQTTNYQVYALFVVNIAKYSSWPTTSAEMDIVVFGKSRVFDELMKQNGKVVNGRTIKVRQVENITEVGHPHVLYVADGKSGAIDEVMKSTVGKPVLIIGEREGLFKKGAGFSFVVMDNSTLRYDINSTELEKRQIKVSKNLSALANSTI